MGYMMLIVEPRGQREQRTPEEGRAVYQRMLDYAATLKARGLLNVAESLANDSRGTRVSARGGKPAFTDGPFSEAKEMIGGIFLLDCATREEALAIAAQCPAAEWATIEVRETGPCYE